MMSSAYETSNVLAAVRKLAPEIIARGDEIETSSAVPPDLNENFAKLVFSGCSFHAPMVARNCIPFRFQGYFRNWDALTRLPLGPEWSPSVSTWLWDIFPAN